MNPQAQSPQTPEWAQAYPTNVPIQPPPQTQTNPYQQATPMLQAPPDMMLPSPVVSMSPQMSPQVAPMAQQGYAPVNQATRSNQVPGYMPALEPMPGRSSASRQTSSSPAIQTSPSVQDEASDSVLDEEWVEKAKQIILRTKGDPYAQGQELAKIKAQYIKARYNKDIKVSEI